jgi:RimJ/RimL family protein N-acetyltransferase
VNDRIIETERLVLRRWRDGDAAAAAPIYAKREVMRYIPGGVWDLARTTAIVERLRARERENGYGIYPVVLKASGVTIGHAGLGPLEDTGEVEVAYVLDAPYWRKGLATEAARAIIAYGFAAAGLERIVAVAFPENQGSVGVMKRCGMTLVGPAHHFGYDLIKYEIVRPG